MERYAGLNIRGFSPVKFFVGILLQCSASSAYYLRTFCSLSIHGKTFKVFLKTMKTAKV